MTSTLVPPSPSVPSITSSEDAECKDPPVLLTLNCSMRRRFLSVSERPEFLAAGMFEAKSKVIENSGV